MLPLEENLQVVCPHSPRQADCVLPLLEVDLALSVEAAQATQPALPQLEVGDLHVRQPAGSLQVTQVELLDDLLESLLRAHNIPGVGESGAEHYLLLSDLRDVSDEY